ncbi:hypothetical protein Tco_1422529, partial [Tanacetum coccineum]
TDTPYLLDGYGVLVFRISSFKLQNARLLLWIPCKHAVGACWNMALNDRATPPLEAWVGRPKKKRKRNIRHNKATCKGQGRKATTDGNNAAANGSASRQAQQAEHAVGQDGSGG